MCFSPGAVVLQVSCFSEAERIYMLAKDTTVNNKTLTSLVIPEILVTTAFTHLQKHHTFLSRSLSSISASRYYVTAV